MTYNVFLVEDEAVVRNGMRNQLEKSDTFFFCGEAGDGELALASMQELHPDILITDIKMPFMDGLSLAKIIRKTHPWMKIIIISGYEAFEFAQQALSLGVDEYLLKPVSARQLFGALEKAAAKIEEEKRAVTAGGGVPLDQARGLMRDHFLDELTAGLLDSPTALERAAQYGVSLLARYYVVAEAEITPDGPHREALEVRRQRIAQLWAEREDVIWFFKGSDRLVLIIKGDSADLVNEAAYEAACTLQQGLLRLYGAQSTIGIGVVCERLAGLTASLGEARRVLHLLLGTGRPAIMSSTDLSGMQPAPSRSETGLGALEEQLRYAVAEDAQALSEIFLQRLGTEPLRSRLYTFYQLGDLAAAAARLLEENGASPEALLPPLPAADQLLSLAASDDALRAYACALLRVAAQENSHAHASDPILRAKRFIQENFADRSISLHSVARHIGFSPSHFSTVFSTRTGQTFIEYLTGVRIARAKVLLRVPGAKTADVAYAVGYGDPRYFKYLFKKTTRMTPRAFVEAGADG